MQPIPPDSLELLDVLGSDADAERFLHVRWLHRVESTVALTPADVREELTRIPGEVLHVASRDETLAAAITTIRDEHGRGGTYLTVHSTTAPEPAVGALLELAEARARALGVTSVRCGGTEDQAIVTAVRERHGFDEHERWRRFHIDIAADTPLPTLPPGVDATTLEQRPDLIDAAARVYREALDDTPGDFPRPDRTPTAWLAEIDASSCHSRDLVLLLVDADYAVLAVLELERLSAGSPRAEIEFLAVDRAHRRRGLARCAKRAAERMASEAGLSRLETVNHADNAGIIRLNEQLGWVEGLVRTQLRRDLAPLEDQAPKRPSR